MSVRATVVIPTHDHGSLLGYAASSALDQTVEDIELFIVGDGVTDQTRTTVGGIARSDDRVRFFDNPKGPRLGEIHRRAALAEARGEIVCYLSDDDVWFPDHLERMFNLLDEADFAHTCPLSIGRDGSIFVYVGDLSDEFWRGSILEGSNFIPLTMAGHTLEMYRRLPHGWRTTPAGMPTDLYMWQQFLADPTCRAISDARPTALHFPSPDRTDMTAEERASELGSWSDRRGDPGWREHFAHRTMESLYRERALFATHIKELHASRADVTREYERIAEDNEALRVELEKAAAALAAHEEERRGYQQEREAYEAERAMYESERRRYASEAAQLRATLAERDGELGRAYGTWTWRVRQRVLRAPGVGPLVRAMRKGNRSSG